MINIGVSMRSPAPSIVLAAAVKRESRGFWATARTWLLDLFTAPSMRDVEPRCPPSVAFTPTGPLVYQWQIDGTRVVLCGRRGKEGTEVVTEIKKRGGTASFHRYAN